MYFSILNYFICALDIQGVVAKDIYDIGYKILIKTAVN